MLGIGRRRPEVADDGPGTSDAIVGSKEWPALILAAAGAAVIAALFQLVHVRDVGSVEEWGIYSLFDRAGVVFWTPASTDLQLHAGRPFVMVPFSIGYLLTENSFVGLHIVQAAGMAVQAAAGCLLLRVLGTRIAPAFVGGLLFALFPAFQWQFSLRAVHIHWTLAFVTIALLLYAIQVRSSIRWKYSIPMIVCGLTGFFMYDSPYLIYVIAAPLVFLRPGWTWRAVLPLLGAWFAAPLIAGGRLVVMQISGQTTYQASLADSRSVRDPAEWIDLYGRIWTGVARIVSPANGWAVTAFSLVMLVVALAIVAALSLSDRHQNPSEPRMRWRMGWVGVGALVLGPLAAMVYTQERLHLVDPLRIFSVTALPMTIGVVVTLSVLVGDRTRLAAGISLVLAVLVILAAAGEREHQRRQAVAQQQILGAVESALTIDGSPRSAPVVVVDDSGLLQRGYYTLMPDTFPGALNYVDRQPGRATTVCQDPSAPTRVPIAICEFSKGILTVDGVAQPATTRVVALMPGGRSPAPSRSALPIRARVVLPCIERMTCATGPTGVSAVVRREP